MDIKVVNPIPQEDINFIINTFQFGLIPYEFKKIGHGFSAEVFRYKNYAIKVFEDEGFYDGEILENFQDNELFPKLYFYNEDIMVTEHLNIVNAYQYFERNLQVPSADEICKYCLDKGFLIGDIHDENVVVTLDEKLKIIDVGAFKKTGCNLSLGQAVQAVYMDYIELGNIIEHIKRPPIAI